jgi:hypothetical protein
MSRIARKGFTAALLVCLLAAPIAAAAPAERAGEREAPASAGWFEGLVEWVGGWLLGTREGADPSLLSERRLTPERIAAGDGNDGGSQSDPDG